MPTNSEFLPLDVLMPEDWLSVELPTSNAREPMLLLLTPER